MADSDSTVGEEGGAVGPAADSVGCDWATGVVSTSTGCAVNAAVGCYQLAVISRPLNTFHAA